MSEMRAYALEKAARGEQVPGHKYKSRKRGVDGSWVYDYGYARAAYIRKKFGKASTEAEIKAAQEAANSLRFSVDETAAILDWSGWGGHTIRNNPHGPRAIRLQKAIARAEARLDRKPLLLFRGLRLTDHELARLEKANWRKIIADKGLASWTANPEIAGLYAQHYGGGPRVLLRVRTARGLPVPTAVISKYANESEVILPPLALRVRSVKTVAITPSLRPKGNATRRKERPFTVIELEEVK